MKKKSFVKNYCTGEFYKIIILNPEIDLSALKIIGEAEYIRLEIDAEKWKDSQLADLKRKLKSLSALIIRNIALSRSSYILNFLEIEHNRDNCPFWERMITNDSRGNFVLAPPFASSRGKGAVMGRIGGDMSFYSSCVYWPESAQCVKCVNKNFKKLNKIWNMKAVDIFDSAIFVLHESIKVLSVKNPKFKRYLKELAAIKNSKTQFLGGLKF